MERYDPGIWKNEFAFLNRPDQGDIQADLATLASAESQLSVICGKYDLSFEPSEPEAYRAEVPGATIHVLDAKHFALDTAADEIAV